MEPEPFADYSGPNTLDVNRCEQRGWPWSCWRGGRRHGQYGRAGWGLRMHSLKAGGNEQQKWVIAVMGMQLVVG